MATFYHIDTLGMLKEGQVINLINYSDYLLEGELESDINDLNQFFDNGISLRGRTLDEKNKHFELIYELIRRNKYNDKISRFEAFFGIENLEQIREIKRKLKIFHPVNIFEVECNEYSKLDMNWLSYCSGLECLRDAYNYWEGKCSNKPLWEILMRPPIKIKNKI